MLFGIAKSKRDGKIKVDFVGIEENGEETNPVYRIKIDNKEIYVTLVANKDAPVLILSTNCDTLIKMMNNW